MTEIIRKLKLRFGVSEIDVTIRIGWPFEEQNAWTCRWDIGWPDRKRSNSAHGVDAAQALINALMTVGTEVYCSDEHKAGRLRWSNDWAGYGFPVPNNVRDLMTGDDKKYL